MANSTSKAAENALRRLLKNMRNGVNHTQALANFKEAVQAYNRAQVIAVNAANKAIGNPTDQKVNGVTQALTRLEGLHKVVAAAKAAAAKAAAAKATKGNNNSKVRKNTGKKQGFLGRVGGAVRGVGGAVVGGARATRGALGGFFGRRPVRVNPNSEMARLTESTN